MKNFVKMLFLPVGVWLFGLPLFANEVTTNENPLRALSDKIEKVQQVAPCSDARPTTTQGWFNEAGQRTNRVFIGDRPKFGISLQNGTSNDLKNIVIKIQYPDIAGVKIPDVSAIDVSSLITARRTPVVSYDDTTRTFIVSSIDEALFLGCMTDQRFVYAPMELSSDCDLYNDACSNILSPYAEVTYSYQTGAGTITTGTSAQRGYIGIGRGNACYRSELLCTGATMNITASGTGYTAYQWYKNGSVSPANLIPGETGASYAVTAPGSYVVVKKVDCQLTGANSVTPIDTQEVIIVSPENNITDPIRVQADGGAECGNDGIWESHIYLCNGITRTLRTNFHNAQKVVWQRYAAGCTTSTLGDCHSRNTACWTDVKEDKSFEVSTAGTYRLLVVSASGCEKAFYFNVYTTGLLGQVQVTHQSNFEQGSVRIEMGTEEIDYTYTIKENGVIIANGTATLNVPPTHEYTFRNIAIPRNGSRTFQVEVTSERIRGCKFTETVTVRDQRTMIGTAKFDSWRDCQTAKFRFEGQGGQSPYSVAVYKIGDKLQHEGYTPETVPATNFIVSGEAGKSAFDGYINITNPGERYEFVVRDANGSSVVTESILVPINPEFAIETSNTPISCFGGATTITARFVRGISQQVTLEMLNNDGEWEQVAQNNSGIFTNRKAGKYRATIARTGAVSPCSFTKEFDIKEINKQILAYVGVVEDISCDTNTTAKRYKININNVTGGAGGYQYSFDGGRTWTNNSQGYVNNTTKVLVKDASGCAAVEFDVVVDPAIEIPSLRSFDPATSITYDCRGKAIFTINPQVSPGKNYAYSYSVDDKDGVRRNNNTFALTPKQNGDPYTIYVHYEDLNATKTETNILLNEDFGTGYATENAYAQGLTYIESGNLGTGNYVQITKLPTSTEFISPVDASGTGRYLALVTAGTSGVLFERVLTGIVPKTKIDVSLKMLNLLQNTSAKADPSLEIRLIVNGVTYRRALSTPLRDGNWVEVPVPFNEIEAANTVATTATIQIVSTNGNTAVALDDIVVKQPTKRCSNFVTLTVTPANGRQFNPTITERIDAVCNGGEGAVIVKVADYTGTTLDYSVDGGRNWLQAPKHTVGGATDLYKIPLPVGDTNNLLVRKELDCNVDLGKVTIKQPAALSINRNKVIVTPLGCEAPYLTATLRMELEGGVRPYQNLKYREKGQTTWISTNTNIIGGVGVITGLEAKTYEITYSDSNNCGNEVVLLEQTIAPKKDIKADITYTTCYSGKDDAFIKVVVTDGGGKYQYRIRPTDNFVSGSLATPNEMTFNNLSRGTYVLEIKDQLGCTLTKNIEINNPLLADMTNDGLLSCETTSQETINLNVIGGTGAKTFRWKRGAGTYKDITDNDGGNVVFNITSAGSTTVATTGTIVLKTTGFYTFEVKDENGCIVEKEFDIQLVNPEWTAGITISADPISCVGNQSGFIGVRTGAGTIRPIDLLTDIDTTKGVGPYTIFVYEQTAGITSPNLGLRGLGAGVYKVYVKDAKGCTSAEQTVTITEIPQPNVTLTATGLSCVAGVQQYGSVTATWNTGGSPSFRVSLLNDRGALARNLDTGAVHQHIGQPQANTITFDGLTAGNYTLVMTDAKGCRTEKTIAVPSSNTELVVLPQTLTDCSTASVKLLVYNKDAAPLNKANIYFAIYTGGNPASVVGWQQATTDETHIIGGTSYPAVSKELTGLRPGVTYNFVVRNNGCYTIYNTNMPAMQTLTPTSVLRAEGIPACGTDNGRVKFELNNIPAGVTNVSYEIYSYPSNALVRPAVTLPVTGGQLQHTEATNTLGAGEYYILFKEQPTNCISASLPFVIKKADQPLQVTLTSTKNENCSAPAELLAEVRNGQKDYKYIFKPNATAPTDAEWAAETATDQPQKRFSTGVLTATATTWYVFVQDAYGCVEQDQVNITKDPAPIVASVTPEDLCRLNGQYSIRVKMNQLGVGRHYYTILRNGVTSSPRMITFTTGVGGVSEFVANNIYSDANPQTLVVYDANKCEATAVTFSVLGNVTYDLSVTRKLTCTATPNGEITVGNLQNMLAGHTYSYKVTFITKTIRMVPNAVTGVMEEVEEENPTPFKAPSPITAAGTTFDVSREGIYRVEIYDDAYTSCPVARNIVVYPKEIPAVIQDNVVDEVCYGTTSIGAGTGSISVSAGSSLLKPFKFRIVKATELSDGSLVTVPTQYSTLTQTSVPNVITIDATGTLATFEKLKGSPTGIQYEIQAVSTINECVSTSLFVTVHSPMDIVIATNAVKVSQFVCGADQNFNNAKITINTDGVSGGNGDYIYIFKEGATEVQRSRTPELIVTRKQGGTYTITIEDAKGCTKDVPGTFVVEPYATIESVTPSQTTAITCAVDEAIDVTITMDPNVPALRDFTYIVQGLNNGYFQTRTSTNLVENFTGLKDGSYKITVVNNKTSCEAYSSYDVRNPNSYVVTADDAVRVTCYDGDDGQITLTFVDTDLSNGDQTNDGFSYVVTDIYDATNTFTGTVAAGTNTKVVTGLKASVYKVVATSTSTNCTTVNESQFSIRQAVDPMQGVASLQYGATCTNDQGEILVELSGGNSPYKITMTKPDGTTEQVTDVYDKYLFIGLQGGATPGTNGTYTFQVEDDWGCTNVVINPVDIENPMPIAATITATNTSCQGASNGTITISGVTGGSGAGTYYYEVRNTDTAETYPVQTSNVFTNLPKGNYEITIIDKWSCVFQTTAVINDPAPIVLTQQGISSTICFDDLNSGYIKVSVTGGTAPYTLNLVDVVTRVVKQQLTNQQENREITISNLNPDVDYEIEVVDDLGCKLAVTHKFKLPHAPDLTISSINLDEECKDGSYDVKLLVKFKRVLDLDKVRYAMNSTSSADAKPFDVGSTNLTGQINKENLQGSASNQYITLFYSIDGTWTPTSTLCHKESPTFFIKDIQDLELAQDTRTQLPLNTIKVEAKFGTGNYKYRFNAGEETEESTYRVKREDPDYIDPVTGKKYKHIIVSVTDYIPQKPKRDEQGNLIYDSNGNMEWEYAYGCTRTLDVYYEFLEIEIPRYFTPTGDGINDGWAPRNTELYPNMTVEIFDRYGRPILKLRQGEKWDGLYEGKLLPTGDYWYILKLNEENDDREFKGHFTLYR